jgi:alanine dehydrogenase
MPKIYAQSHLEPLEETLAIVKRPDKLFIGIARETTFQERRVPLVPASVATLVANGHRVVIETGAGDPSNHNDREYAEAGAEIAFSKKHVFEAALLLKAAPPTLEEIELLRPDQIVISPLHLPTIDADYLNRLLEKRVTALAMEYIKDEAGSFPIVRILSELAGTASILTAAELLSKSQGMGVLLGGISGVPPAKVVILGAGLVAEFATRAALGLGAEIRVFDDNVYKLMRIQNQVGHQLYTSTINPTYLKQELLTADVAIGAMHSETGRTPCIVGEDIVMQMKQGAVIVDVSIDQGGCFATSEVTTHDKPYFVKHGIVHYCVPNIASKVPRTASTAISNILTAILLRTDPTGNIGQLLYRHRGLQHGVYAYKGCLTNDYLGHRFRIKSMDLSLLLASSL